MADNVLGSVRSRLLVTETQEVLWDQVFFNPQPSIERLTMDIVIEGVKHTWELTFEPPLEIGELVEAPDE